MIEIQEKIRKYREEMSTKHHRCYSWERCYRYFHGRSLGEIAKDKDHASLQLGFYLASWGMYRGSGFLLKHAYTVHRDVIDRLVSPKFERLWDAEFGCQQDDCELVVDILSAVTEVREAYGLFAEAKGSRAASDTLVTKVILGTIGCLPAYDRYFIAGLKNIGLRSTLNKKEIECFLRFCQDNRAVLSVEQARIEQDGGGRYPIMKLVDMCFWQTGYDLALERDNTSEIGE